LLSTSLGKIIIKRRAYPNLYNDYNTFEKVLLYHCLGFIYIITYSVGLSVFNQLNQNGVSFVMISALLLLGIIIIENKRSERSCKINAHRDGSKKNYEIMIVFLIISLAISFIKFFRPAIIKSLANYPGGDDKGYAVITKQIIDYNSAFVSINYPFSPPVSYHALMAGFMVIAAFYYNIFKALGAGVSIPLLHLYLALHFFSITSVSIYLYAKKITKNVIFSAVLSLASIFMWKAILLYFSWGGESESLGYAIIPVLAIVDYQLTFITLSYDLSIRERVFIELARIYLILVIAYIHIYSFMLYLTFVFIVNPLLLILGSLNNQVCTALKRYFIVVLPIITTIAIMPLIILILRNICSVMNSTNEYGLLIRVLYSEFFINPRRDIMIQDLFQRKWSKNWLILRPTSSILEIITTFRKIIKYFNGSWVEELLMLTLALTCFPPLAKIVKKVNANRDYEEHLVTLFVKVIMLAALLFFIFTQNNPFGLYYLPYPLARQILVVRLYYEWSMLLLFIQAYPLYTLIRDTAFFLTYIGKELKNSSFKKKLRKKMKILPITSMHYRTIIFFIIMFVITTNIPAISHSYNAYVIATREAVITQNDLKAFEWIRKHTSPNAVFFVNPADAGPYIYIYTNRVVLPPTALRLWALPTSKSKIDFKIIKQALITGNINNSVYFLLLKYNITYIYVGEKTQYGQPKFNTSSLLESPFFLLVFNIREVYIFMVKKHGVQEFMFKEIKGARNKVNRDSV